jgi:hypothetical protein
MHKKCLLAPVFLALCAFCAVAQEPEKTAGDLASEYDRPAIEIFGGLLLSAGVVEFVGLDTFSAGLGYVDYAPVLERNIGFAVFVQAVFPRELTYQVEESKKTVYKKSGDTAVWGADFSIGMVRRLAGFVADTDARKFGLWVPGFVGLRASYFDARADKGTTSESFQRIGLGLEGFMGLEFHFAVKMQPAMGIGIKF